MNVGSDHAKARMMNSAVDGYLAKGCGRCPLGGTPQCKVHAWRKELRELRRIVLACELTEEVKWSVPCYTLQGHNVCVVSAFNRYCALSFFRGSLLGDPHKLLDKPGKHSQAARLMRFTNVQEIVKMESVLKSYLFEAIQLEKEGLRVAFKKNPEPMPEELRRKLEGNPALTSAFEALTPGRQRGYILHFSQPKQSKTRASRVKRYVPKILAGKGFHD